ncbi:MAG: hypothetical protein JWM21_4059 [Acidobacteria bacterium]|nr:hypothetical protein [Acidobacteriota bacterium]
MSRKLNLVVAVLAMLLGLAGTASSQTGGCNCANASLVGDTVGTRFNLGPGPINRVVGSGIELPGAGPLLGGAGPSPRWNIDFGSNTIRIDFLQQPATYGMGSYFTFSNLDPQLPGCPPAFISGITVTTNKPANQFNVVAAATFGPHTVTIQIAPSGGNLNWTPPEFILVRLNYACGSTSTVPTLGCCNCLGGTNTLNLSTISSNNWTINNNPVAFPGSINSYWNLNPAPASWVSTVASGSTGTVPPGTYDYKLQFVVPHCAIEQRVTLSGNYGGDDDIFVYLDTTNNANLISQCTLGWCFNTQNPPPPITNYSVPQGPHTLIVRVKNSGANPSPSGMFINAKLTGTCVSQ